jgi:hypothetical protein
MMRCIPISELADNDARFHLRDGKELPTDWDYLEISKNDSLYLRVQACGDDDRFAKLFSQTWEKIPACYRQEMARWWKEHPDFYNVCSVPAYVVPHIELRKDLPDEEEPAAICDRGGLQLLFRSQIIDTMPCQMVKFVIAHELAHVWQHAVARRALTADPASLLASKNGRTNSLSSLLILKTTSLNIPPTQLQSIAGDFRQTALLARLAHNGLVRTPANTAASGLPVQLNSSVKSATASMTKATGRDTLLHVIVAWSLQRRLAAEWKSKSKASQCDGEVRTTWSG